jgi:hypothetical protein
VLLHCLLLLLLLHAQQSLESSFLFLPTEFVELGI